MLRLILCGVRAETIPSNDPDWTHKNISIHSLRHVAEPCFVGVDGEKNPTQMTQKGHTRKSSACEGRAGRWVGGGSECRAAR